MLKKILYVVGGVAVLIMAVFIVYLLQERSRLTSKMESENPNRYFDVSAITDYHADREGLNLRISGNVVNNTWKMRDISVWAGFVKSDGFHEGAATGRPYYEYQYFPDVKPQEKRPFTFEVAIPPLNRSWSVIAEFDPDKREVRPVWKEK